MYSTVERDYSSNTFLITYKLTHAFKGLFSSAPVPQDIRTAIPISI